MCTNYFSFCCQLIRAFLRVHVVLLGATGSMVNFTYVYQLFFPFVANYREHLARRQLLYHVQREYFLYHCGPVWGALRHTV